MSQHSDAEVLDLCTHLQAMQVRWQRLYDATSDEPGLTTPADHAWSEYSNMVWPAVRLATWGDNPLHPDDVPGRLRLLRATTPEGQAAKATAILALDYAASWCDCRDDTVELMHSLLRDVAGRLEPDPA